MGTRELGKDLLQREFERRRKKNPQYSLRAFARFLQLPSGRLCELLSNKRRFTQRIAEQIADRLELSPREQKRLLASVGSADATHETYKLLSTDTFAFISDWYHFALLALIDIERFRETPAWIARKLGISSVQARAAIERMIRMGILKRNPNGKLEKSQKNYSCPGGVASSAIRKNHKQTLQHAIESLENVRLELRDISSMTFAMDLKSLPEAVELIKEFRREFSKILESGSKNSVYRLNIQLLPVSKVN